MSIIDLFDRSSSLQPLWKQVEGFQGGHLPHHAERRGRGPLHLLLPGSVSLAVCLCLSLARAVHLSVSLLCRPVCLSVCLAVSVSLSFHLSVYDSRCLYVSFSLTLSICLSLHLCVPVCLSVSLYVRVSLSRGRQSGGALKTQALIV